MKSKIKKIIAREGLVIIGIILVAITLGFISGMFHYQEPAYLYRCSLEEHIYEIEFSNYMQYYNDEGRLFIFKAVKALNPKDFESYKNDNFLPDAFKIDYLGQKYTLIGHIKNFFSNMGLFILFLAYPVYLLIRLIVWAVRTLKEK